ncbi:MAG TPA: hypothetical protein VHN77_06780 [Phycisphaerales bacterium]|nr:hypothetical protein [Phycisphaerales bacterium]
MLYRAACLLFIMLCVCSCASPRAPGTSPPRDFSAHLTVLGGPDASPAWYAVGADNTLRISRSLRTASTPVPPAARVLSRGEVLGVWQRSAALETADGAARIASEAAALPATASIAYAGVLLSTTGNGATRCYVFVPPTRGNADAWDACLRFAQHMESLSQARDPSLP